MTMTILVVKTMADLIVWVLSIMHLQRFAKRHRFLLKKDFNLKAISKILGHSKEIITADNYIDNQELIADGVKELQEYIQEVLPPKPQNYSEKEKLFDCSDFDVSEAFEGLIA